MDGIVTVSSDNAPGRREAASAPELRIRGGVRLNMSVGHLLDAAPYPMDLSSPPLRPSPSRP
ncbi:hypothetical protein [Streptomyces sp. NPDC002785]|uniref:hypothetical protein n=1 Tax=Streptomyces sp. NPDC002785 TaxID=3154543 RepID=UPI00332DA5AC